MINIGKEINSILRNKYVKISFIVCLLIILVSFNSKFSKYFSIKLENIIYRLLLILCIILLFVNKHYELSIMLVLIFIVSLYNSKLRSLLKLKIENAVNKLDEKIEKFVIKDNLLNQGVKQNKVSDEKQELKKNKILTHEDIIYSGKPLGQIVNEDEPGFDSYCQLNNETPKDLSEI